MTNILSKAASHAMSFAGLKRRSVLMSICSAAMISAGMTLAGQVGAQEINYPSYHWNEPTYGAFLKEVTADYVAAHPGVSVKSTFVPFGGFDDQMFIDIQSGMAPDILTALDPAFRRYVDADLLEPLNPYLDAAGVKLEDFIAPEQLAVKDGKIYGIVFVTNPRGLFLNGKMIKDAGLPLPTDEAGFMDVVEKLRDPATQTFGLALTAHSGAPAQQYLEYSPIFAAFGAKFFTAGKPSADAPEMLKALTFYKKVVDESLVPKGSTFEVYRPMFVNGKVAMYAAGPFMGGVTAAGNPDTFASLETMRIPLGNGAPITVTNFLSVPKDAPNKEAAIGLLMEMLKPERQARMVELIKAIPGIKGSVPASFVSANPWFKTFDDLAGIAVSYAPEGAEQYGSDIIAIIGGHIEAMLFSGVSPEDTQKAIQADLVAFMESK